MSEKKEWPRLGPMELVRGLGCCTKAPGDLQGCRVCPLYELRGEMETDCFDEIILQAAAMIQRLYDAGEKAAEEKIRKLVDMAKEANTALERGLHGVNHAQLAEMTGIQSDLAELGRDSVIRAEPVPGQDGSQRIAEVIVGGVTVFSAECSVLSAELETHSDISTGERRCLNGSV